MEGKRLIENGLGITLCNFEKHLLTNVTHQCWQHIRVVRAP